VDEVALDLLNWTVVSKADFADREKDVPFLRYCPSGRFAGPTEKGFLCFFSGSWCLVNMACG
jgi:hypothetical protein